VVERNTRRRTSLETVFGNLTYLPEGHGQVSDNPTFAVAARISLRVEDSLRARMTRTAQTAFPGFLLLVVQGSGRVVYPDRTAFFRVTSGWAVTREQSSAHSSVREAVIRPHGLLPYFQYTRGDSNFHSALVAKLV
jgi:hypothetical protein